MAWTPEDVANERPRLEAMARYKYDEYQQFSPGMRFVESLALWLDQFGSLDERNIAYAFVMSRLIFCSSNEMNHLVGMAYHDHVRPYLVRRAARDASLPPTRGAAIAQTSAFRIRQRECLFLGLSDGARIDVFRRANPHLSHEQMFPTYEIPDRRVGELLHKLNKDLAEIDPRLSESARRFSTVVLLDDFSASGISYIRLDGDGSYGGKIGRFYASLMDPMNPLSKLIDVGNAEVVILLYMATARARAALARHLKEIESRSRIPSVVSVVHPIGNDISTVAGGEERILELLERYYDAAIEDEHTQKGGTDMKFGFAACGLPIVLSHNTPNNSLYLLWAQTQSLRPLFPRISRHR
jgi:hypothetical protein